MAAIFHLILNLNLYLFKLFFFFLRWPEEKILFVGSKSSWLVGCLQAMNLARGLAVLLGWMVVSLRPSTDLLYKHLRYALISFPLVAGSTLAVSNEPGSMFHCCLGSLGSTGSPAPQAAPSGGAQEEGADRDREDALTCPDLS